MVTLPEPWLACPRCGALDHHLLEHIPCPPGMRAWWPDPAAPHYRRECRWCCHEWREPA